MCSSWRQYSRVGAGAGAGAGAGGVLGVMCALLALAAPATPAQKKWEGAAVSEAELRGLARVPSDVRALAGPLLVPRVVGTAQHAAARQHLVDTLRALGWHVQLDEFVAHTPTHGNLTFSNVVATLGPVGPPGARPHLVLAAHYDSKYMPAHPGFVGATDSAVPCAMLLALATALRPQLAALNATLSAQSHHHRPSLMLVFFDGEEAFAEWTDADSLYGARHLAERWEREGRLRDVSALVLLDLLGAPDPVFYSYWPATERWHAALGALEARLAEAGLLRGYSVRRDHAPRYFQLRSSRAHIMDDHLPFLQRSVQVLHLIPSPFPPCWHEPCDDATNIDWTTVAHLDLILRAFLAHYLHLPAAP